MRILFLDPLTLFAYDAELMRSRGIGGTERSVVVIAEGLSTRHEVVVAQRARAERSRVGDGPTYAPLDEPDPFGGPVPDVVVLLRKHRLAPGLRSRFPRARMVSWIHNWQRPEAAYFRAGLARSRCSLLAVSDVHRDHTERLVNGPLARAFGSVLAGGGRIPVERIYNPVSEDLAPDGTEHDPDKLVFFSTANKGLSQVLGSFHFARERIPGLRLYVAGTDPEVLRRDPTLDARLLDGEDVHLLGRLTQAEVLRHVRESLCVFYPQNVYSETFGLVYAESNAVGTPVLAHDFGAAREVLGGPEQLVDAADREAVLQRLAAWRAGGRPRVSLRPPFRASVVVDEWLRFVEWGGAVEGQRSA